MNELHVIPRNQLPEDARDWARVDISLPRRERDTAIECSRTENEVFAYVQKESGDVDRADRLRLRFGRTAKVEQNEYWLWEYIEEDGSLCYVVAKESPDGSMLGMADANGLSHEQFILAEHYEEVYW